MDNLSESEKLQLLQLLKAKAQAQDPSMNQVVQQAPEIAQQAIQAANPLELTKKFFGTDPATMQRVAGPALPIVGGALAGPAAPAGAAVGEFLRQATGTALAPDTVPKTPLGRAASVGAAGILQEPKMLDAIPGVPQVNEFASNMASKAKGGLAKLAQVMTGLKAPDVIQAAKQGVSTYAAPSMEKAQQIFGKALEDEGIASKRPLEQIIDPQLATARDVALTAGRKFEAFMQGSGEAPTAEELLRGRQAVDRIYNATSMLDRGTRGDLAELRRGFDDMLSTVSEKVGSASKVYRQSVVKDAILNPLKITKQGQMSAVAPMVATLASSIGAGTGHKKEAGIGGLGYLLASSPMVAGLGATIGGSTIRGLTRLMENPANRQALLGVLQRVMANKQNNPSGNNE